MKIASFMNDQPRWLRGHESLAHAAWVMWDRDCGWVPVVDEDVRVIGVITDRDICMAAYTRGMSLDDMVVAGTMSTNVHIVHADDEVETALAVMRNYRVRRVPVVSRDGVLEGLVSLSDLARRAAGADSGVHAADVLATIAQVSEPRTEPAC